MLIEHYTVYSDTRDSVLFRTFEILDFLCYNMYVLHKKTFPMNLSIVEKIRRVV